MSNIIKLLTHLAFKKKDIVRPMYLDGEKYLVDVKNFITPDDIFLQKVVKDYKNGKDYDDKMQKCWQYVRDNIKYKSDKIDGERKGHWTLPSIILQRGYDDCDGMSVTLASLAIASGIPYYRVKVVLGKVQKDPVAPKGSHAWVLYLNEDNKWEIWEATNKKKGRKGLAKELLGNSWYREIYASFNNKYTYDQDKIEDETKYK